MAPKSVIAAGIRAARGYAGLTIDALAEATDISAATISRLENPDWPLPRDWGRTGNGYLDQIAEATGVPRAFLDHGFSEETVSAAEELEAIYQRVVTMLGSFYDRRHDIFQMVDRYPTDADRIRRLEETLADIQDRQKKTTDAVNHGTTRAEQIYRELTDGIKESVDRIDDLEGAVQDVRSTIITVLGEAAGADVPDDVQREAEEQPPSSQEDEKEDLEDQDDDGSPPSQEQAR